jgi:hypothetical protein
MTSAFERRPRVVVRLAAARANKHRYQQQAARGQPEGFQIRHSL